MALTASFAADFSAFTRSISDATVNLQTFDRATKTAMRDLQRSTESFSGQKLAVEAARMAEAVERVGGVSKLTDNELKKVLATTTEFTAKMKALGQDVPPAIQKLHTEVDTLGKRLDTLGSKSTTASGLVGQLFSQFGGAISAGVILRVAQQTISWADDLVDLSRQTGLSTTTLQQWDQVAKANGNTLDDLTKSTQRLGADLVSGEKSVVAGIQKLGLATDELLHMRPEDRLREVAKAIAEIKDPAQRASAELEIFHRSGMELDNTLRDLAEGSDKAATAIGEDWIETGALMQDAIDGAWAKAKAFAAYIVLSFPKSMKDGVDAWRNALLIAGDNPALPGAPKAGPNAWGQLPKFDPLGGNTMAFLEQDLTRSTNELIQARTRTARATAANEVAESALQAASAANAWAMQQARNNPFDWQMNPRNRPFPGWAVPMTPIPSRSLDLLNPALWTGTGAGMFHPAVQAVSPSAATAPGGFWNFLTGNSARPFLNAGLGFATQFIPGLSGQGSGIGSGFGSALGSASGVANALGGFASFLGPIGGIVGGLIGKLFGPSEATKTRRERSQFLEDFGGLAKLQEQAEHAGFSLDRLLNTKKVKDFEAEVKKLDQALQLQAARDALKKVEDDFIAAAGGMDKLSAQAEVLGFDLEKALKADTIDHFNDQMKEFERRLSSTNEKFAPLLSKADQLGIKLPNALELSLKKLRDMGVLVGDNARLVDRLLSGTDAVSHDVLAGIAERLGIPNNALGTIFNIRDIQGRATSLTNDLSTLFRGGADVGGVLNTPSVQALFRGLVNDAISNRVSLPENLRPFIEELSRVGGLNTPGTKDRPNISELVFGPEIKTDFEENTQALLDLIGSLESGPMVEALTNGPLIQALTNFPREFTITIPNLPTTTTTDRTSGSGGDRGTGDTNTGGGGGIDERGVAVATGGLILGRGRVLHFARGGLVRGDYGDFDPVWQPRGTDTVPAMLTPGEVVITSKQAKTLGNILDQFGPWTPIPRVPLESDPVPAPRLPEVREFLPVPRVPPKFPQETPFNTEFPVDRGGRIVPIIVVGDVTDRNVGMVFSQLPRALQTGEVNRALRAAVAKIIDLKRAS